MRKIRPIGRNDTHILDYSKITDNIFVGSDFCHGRDCKDHTKEFKSLGVGVEINLTSEKKELPPDNTISYTWLPVVDGYAPSEAQFDIGTSIINEAIKAGKKVYIHCKNGHGRSPTLVAAYLIRFRRMTVGEAEEFVRKKRPEVHLEDRQKKALETFSRLVS